MSEQLLTWAPPFKTIGKEGLSIFLQSHKLSGSDYCGTTF